LARACALSEEDRAVLVRELGDDFADSWEIRARDERLPPPGDWWCLIQAAGRGWGKRGPSPGMVARLIQARRVGAPRTLPIDPLPVLERIE